MREDIGRAFEVLKRHVAVTTALFCGLFGIALILNTQLSCDGVWYWYARGYLRGQRLYADLGLRQQPLYILLHALTLKLLGPGWLVSKVLALVGLALYLVPICLLAKQSRCGNLEQGALIAFAFFVGIHFEAYRFDDYHVIVHGLYLASAVLLLHFGNSQGERPRARLVVLLGLMSGLAAVTRPNDGILLIATAALLVVVLAPARRFALMALMLLFATLTILAVVMLTGDSISDWIRFSMLDAAACKGGVARLMAAPALLPLSAARDLMTKDGLLNALQLLALFVLALLWVEAKPLDRSMKFAGRGLLLVLACPLFVLLRSHDTIITASAASILVGYGAMLWLAWSAVLALFRRDPASVLGDARFIMLVPIGIWVSNSLGSGGDHVGQFPFALFVVLLFVLKPVRFFDRQPMRTGFFAVIGFLAISGAVYRYTNPCSWNSYATFPLFEHRLVVNHRLYGPMVVDRSLYALFSSISSEIERGGGELLSLPFPYANYFCGIPPWNGYVQTFFDTSEEKRIGRLMDQLKINPPTWILYQRQLGVLGLHERVYNSGRPLPHRALHMFLMERIASGQWRVVKRTSDRKDNDWILLRTK